MHPTFSMTKLFIVECGSFEPILIGGATCSINGDGHYERNGREYNQQFEESTLKQEIEVAICAAMRDPIVHVELSNDAWDESDENIIGLGLVEEFTLVDFLDVEVPVDWNLN